MSDTRGTMPTGAQIDPDTSRFGSAAISSVTIACGLMLVAIADVAARAANPWASVVFWSGLLVMLVPVAVRMCDARITRRESVTLATVLALGFYLVKVLHSPTAFTFTDEFVHWRSVTDVVETGRLFQPNAILPVVSSYPGLASVTSAVADMSGATPFAAGVVVLACVRLVLTWSLYLLFWHATRSARLAGIASLVYMANPNYLFFQSQFAYESLALPFTAALLAFVVRDAHGSEGEWSLADRVTWLLALVTVVVTHHMTALAAIGYVALILVAAWTRRPRLASRTVLLTAALLLALSTSLWTATVASRATGYLWPVFEKAGVELGNVVVSESSTPAKVNQNQAVNRAKAPSRQRQPASAPGGRRLFQSYAGDMAPLGERATAIASVLAVLAILPVGIWFVFRHRRERVAMALGVASLAYPFSLALRLTPYGTEVSNRASEHLFIAVALIAAIAIERTVLTVPRRRVGEAVFAMWLSVVFAGGLIIGWPPWNRMPGPYRVSSVDRYGVEAARWAADALGSDRRVVADRTQMRLMYAYGHERPVTFHTDRLHADAVLLGTSIGPQERRILKLGGIEYVVVDRRIAEGLPPSGVYVEAGEPNAFSKVRPIGLRALDKFNALPAADRVFDNGAIQVYDVEGVVDGAP